MTLPLSLAALLAAASPAAPPHCGARGASVETLRALPAAARLELARYLAPDGIADAGERRDTIDVRHPGVPRHRLVRADRVGDDWVVRYESAGIAARWDTVTLVPVAAGDRPARYVARAGDRCARGVAVPDASR
ncbi:hypothetical protein KZ813_14730 [Sphingomonas sp. RHCKR7]|uniref:hypothetical protein n=1 Tax=Sphingomonas folli TaxID=2862497 RepID=UPI001CA48B53|nr:hypothetical protein [Sphingomonas folli]MBW6528096.1 hypothetical protein [Sphingomonas folli]